MKEKIINLFSIIAKPYKDKEGGEKLENIQKWLEERNITNEFIPGIGKIVNKQENPRIILVSHIDLIRKFQKGFSEGKTHEIINSKKGKEIIQGALDNTITNSVALLVLESLLAQNITDIELVLTEGEEVGTIGMDNYLKEYKDKALNSFFVNLDVSNDGWKKNVSLEYDNPSFYGIKHILDVLENHDIHITTDRVGDDIDAVNENECFGFSFCLPTKETIHSYENKAYTDSLSGYYNALYDLLTSFEYNINLKDTFSPFLLDKAIEESNPEKFKEISRDYEKNKFLKERQYKNNYSKSDVSYEISEIANSLTTFILSKLENKNDLIKTTVYDFIEEKMFTNSSFFLSDLALVLKKEEYPFIKARELLEILSDFGTIEKKEHYFRFRRR